MFFLFFLGADKQRSKIKKVHFYWVNRDKEAFEWFADLLSELEENNIGNFLEINVFLTARVSKEDDIKKLLAMEETGVDEVTGLQTGTTYGRPPWDKIFLQHAETYQGQTVGVFFCGPKVSWECRINHSGIASQTRILDRF